MGVWDASWSRKAIWAGLILRRAVSRSKNSARSTSGKVRNFPERGGYSIVKVLLTMAEGSQSPSKAQAWTSLPAF